MSEPVVIVGGGPAAKAAIEGYHEAGGERGLVLIAAESHLPYSRPPLTKDFLRGESERDELTLEEGDWYEERGVDLVLGTRVERLDPDRRELESADGRTWTYASCLLAMGARPARPGIPGVDSPGIRTIRTIEDSMRISGDAREGRSLIVVGSGFIGCELAASAAMRGAKVTLVTDEDGPQAERLGPEAAEIIADWLGEADVKIRVGKPVEAFARADEEAVVRVGGDDLAADGAVIALGIERNVELARDAGLEVDTGIVCDGSMRTSVEDIFAAGDVAEARNATAGRRLVVEHWGEALAQGEVAGRVMAGEGDTWNDAPGFWSTIGERTLKFAGWGDGWDECEVEGDGSGFAARYTARGELVGVLAHERDDEYERGREEIERVGARA